MAKGKRTTYEQFMYWFCWIVLIGLGIYIVIKLVS